MTPRILLVAGVVCWLLASLSIATVDLACTRWVSQADPAVRDAFAVGTRWLDAVTLRSIYHSLLPIVLIGVGVIVARTARGHIAGITIALSGATCLATHALVNLLKPLFGRLRPWQLNAANDWTDRYFAGGDSLPSGHTAFYFGLFLGMAALACVTRRVRIALLLPAIFIGVARVMILAHFPSDVFVAIGIACVVVASACSARTRWFRSPSMSCAP